MKRATLRISTLLVIGCGLIVSSGCVKKSEYNALKADYDSVVAERDALTQTVQMQEAELSSLESDFEKLAEIFADEIAAQELQLQQLVDGIEVAIPSDVMYKSGAASATVGSEGLEYAKELAAFLSETDYFVSVVGHTDNQPVTKALAKRYPSNWELAGARAANAARFLVSNGVDPKNVIASSRGEFDPVASNDTPEGRAQNRRIQIILRSLPK